MIYVLIASVVILILLLFLLLIPESKGRHRHPDNLRKKRCEGVSYTIVNTEFGPIRIIEDPSCPPDSFYYVAQDKDIA